MLALSRSVRAAHTLRLHARALSTAAAHSASFTTDAEQLSNNNHAPDAPSAAATQQVQTRVTTSDCMYVSPWNGIRSSAEGLAIARAVEDKYGATAKEVVFLRDASSINLFQPYFWLIFDNPNSRKRLPETEALITVHVPDFPWSDGNVGVEEMMRGLGLSTTDSNDPHHHHAPPHLTETEPSTTKNASDETPPPEDYKSLDVRIEWSISGPNEVKKRKRLASESLPSEKNLPRFATAWLAFDGFSPESARGPDTLNLSRAREKWSRLAPPKDVDNVTATPSSSQGTAEVEEGEDVEETETMAEAQENRIFSREWVPIISSSSLAQQPRPASISPQKNNDDDAFATTTPDGPSLNTPLTADAANTAADNTADAAPAPTPAGMDSEPTRTSQGPKLSRRARILQLARQNARTPLPKPAEQPQPPPPPPPPTEAEKLDKESERQGKERTIRDRLWRLVGGNY